MKKIKINSYKIKNDIIIISLFLLFAVFAQILSAQVKCCCGSPKELDFPGLDFELSPLPPVGWFNNYQVGSTLGDWLIISGAIDHVDKEHYFNTRDRKSVV